MTVLPPIFTAGDIAELCNAAGHQPHHRDHLGEALDQCAWVYTQVAVLGDHTPPSVALDSLAVVVSSLKKALHQLREAPPDVRHELAGSSMLASTSNLISELDVQDGPLGRARLDAMVAVLQDLLATAQLAERRAEARKGRKRGKGADAALDLLVETLMEIWVVFWGQPLPLSRSNLDAEPWVRFIKGYTDLLRAKAHLFPSLPDLQQRLFISEGGIKERARKTYFFAPTSDGVKEGEK